MSNRRLLLASLAASTLLLAACGTMQSAPAPITDVLARDPQFSTLSGLIGKAGLGDTLRGAGPFTVFAPTNDAFKAVPAKTLDEIAGNPALLKDVLTNHVVPGKLAAADVRNGNTKSLQGSTLALARAGEFATVEDAMVLAPDLAATNGVIHGIDRVLIPARR